MASSSSSASVSPYQSLTKWLSLKIYQVEVTFSVYIFTPLEKFIFCTSIYLACPLTHPTPYGPVLRLLAFQELHRTFSSSSYAYAFG